MTTPGRSPGTGSTWALTTALAFRQAIWRKDHPDWHVCGIPAAFHVDHGPDFTSRHLEQVMADLGIRAFFSLPGKPRGRGKVERIFGTFNQMCLPHLPGYAPRGTRDRAGQARLSLAELDQAIGVFIQQAYNATPHSETGVPPQQRWESGAFIPRMPGSLEQLDLLLLTVARPRMIRPDGIHFQSLRSWTRCWPPMSVRASSSATTRATSGSSTNTDHYQPANSPSSCNATGWHSA